MSKIIKKNPNYVFRNVCFQNSTLCNFLVLPHRPLKISHYPTFVIAKFWLQTPRIHLILFFVCMYVTFLLYITGTAPETPSGSTSTTKSGGSSGMQAADSGHPDSPDVPEVVDTVVGLVGPPPIDTHLGGPPHEGGPPNGLDPLGPLPPNWEKAYTDKGESYFIGKSLISI